MKWIQGRRRTKEEYAAAGISMWSIRHGNDQFVQSVRKKRKVKGAIQKASRKRNRG